MKKILIKSVNWILTSLIALFGFTGCPPFKGLYAAPSARYTVKGAVVNEAAQSPIEGIRVGYYPAEWDEDAFGPKPEYNPSIAFVITSTNGDFTLTSVFADRGDNVIIPVYVEDVDGAENGLFQSKKIDVDFKDAVWHNGEFTVTTTIQLTAVEIDE